MSAVRASAGFMDSLGAFAQAVGGRLDGDDGPFAGVCTDTRQLRAGDLFIALSGPNFDGHDFVRRAASLGAAGAVVSRLVNCPLPQLVVEDTLGALQRYATTWRHRFRGPLIGVTGSNGKTTVKELIRSIFSVRGEVLSTHGNLNNHIGVPLTLLGLRPTQKAAVVEMGANHAGEIAALSRIAEPTVGVVTLAGAAHLEGFGSIEGVAHAKGELFRALPGDGIAVINVDDRYADLWRGFASHCRQIGFGLGASADVTASDIRPADEGSRFRLQTPGGEAEVALALSGRHNVMNALAAAAVAWGCGIAPRAIAQGLSLASAVDGRLRLLDGLHGSRLVDDSYNANPTSLRAALEWIAAQPGEAWAVLGDMAELGADAEHLHAECGEYARKLGIDRVFAVGPLSRATVRAFGARGKHADDMEDLMAALHEALSDGTAPTVLIKGSRSAGMERVVAALRADAGEGSAPAAGEH